VINFKANEFLFRPLQLNNITGNLQIIKSDLQFNNIKANIAGGSIGLKGLYNSSVPSSPYFNMKFDILKLQYADALNSFVSLRKLAPVMQYIQGAFNTNLIMEGHLNNEMFPILESLNVDGLLETLQGSIKGFKPLDLLADKLKLNSLKNLSISNTKNWISVSNGIIAIKDFNKKIEDIDLNVNGKHNLNGNLDYQFILKIPKAKVASFTSQLKLDHSIDQLNSLLNKVGIGGDVLRNLNILVSMTGTLSKPSFGFKLLNDKGDVTSAQEEITEEIKKRITDSIKTRFEKEKDKAAVEIKKAEDSLINAATKKAEDLKKQALDKILKGSGKSTDTSSINNKDLSKSSLDSIAQKVLNKDAKKESDQIKDKLKDWNPFKKEKK
jgi:6-pyruvoyl-tetrahydropterin synthase